MLTAATPRNKRSTRPARRPGRGGSRASPLCAVRYPYRRKRWRTTIWKNTGIRCKAGVLHLARCRGHAPVRVVLPTHLAALPARSFVEMRLVWDRVACRYTWHLVVDDGVVPVSTTATGVAGVDLGEIHPAALTDGTEATIIACRALALLRAVNQQAPLGPA